MFKLHFAETQGLFVMQSKNAKQYLRNIPILFFIEIFNLPVFFPFKDTPFSFYQTLTN